MGKELEIRMARGDLVTKSFRLIGPQNSTYTIEPDEIYFTVKLNSRDHDYKFQKRLSDGGIDLVETGRYIITIDPEDTDNLLFGVYEFDIEVVKTGSIKKTFCGKLVLEKEVTHHYNEGGA